MMPPAKLYNKLHIFKLYNLMSFELYKFLWNHQLSKDIEDIHHSKKLPCEHL